jgi:ubiquitin C-terminal hydrolase
MADAHEFFDNLIDRINHEQAQLLSQARDSGLVALPKVADVDAEDIGWSRMGKKGQTSVVTARHKTYDVVTPLGVHLLGGQLEIQIKNHTKHTNSASFQPFYSLSIDLPPALSQEHPKIVAKQFSSDLERALFAFQMPKPVTGDAYVTHTSTVEQFPALLVLALKRFDAFMQKIPTYTSFPRILELPLGCKNKALLKRYELRSVVVHHGQAAYTGHYTVYAHRRQQTGQRQWVHFDDNRVTPVAATDVIAQQAYMLIYEQCC